MGHLLSHLLWLDINGCNKLVSNFWIFFKLFLKNLISEILFVLTIDSTLLITFLKFKIGLFSP